VSRQQHQADAGRPRREAARGAAGAPALEPPQRGRQPGQRAQRARVADVADHEAAQHEARPPSAAPAFAAPARAGKPKPNTPHNATCSRIKLAMASHGGSTSASALGGRRPRPAAGRRTACPRRSTAATAAPRPSATARPPPRAADGCSRRGRPARRRAAPAPRARTTRRGASASSSATAPERRRPLSSGSSRLGRETAWPVRLLVQRLQPHAGPVPAQRRERLPQAADEVARVVSRVGHARRRPAGGTPAARPG